MTEPSDPSVRADVAHQTLYRRLVERDPTAPDDVAVTFLKPLVEWLIARNHLLPQDLIDEAAEDAILSLIRTPSSYHPEKSDLTSYLRMSAQGDLRNLLRRESKHRTGRIPLQVVEHSEDAGNYLGRQDDPSLHAQIEEQLAGLADAIPPFVREGLTNAEMQVLKLILQGERRTGVYAKAYGVADLSREEQRRLVKQVKDRLKKRLERARGNDEHAS